jgi:hypothetical protein
MRLWFSRYLTPWSRVMQCVKPEGALPWPIVIGFHHLFLSWIKWIQPMLSHPTKIRFNILPSICRSSSGLFMFPHQGPVIISIYFNAPPYVPGTCDLIIIIVFGDEYKSRSSSLYSFLLSPFTSSWPSYLPQCPVLDCFGGYSFASCCTASQVPIHLDAWCYIAEHNLATLWGEIYAI